MIKPHNKKYFPLYWKMAWAAAEQSYSKKRQVGAILVLPTGMVSVGWNGTPTGLPNACETADGITKPEVIHAERNAIDKMTRQGVPTAGSLLFVTYAPCFECAKAIHGLGLAGVFYATTGNHPEGVQLLNRLGVPCEHQPTQTTIGL